MGKDSARSQLKAEGYVVLAHFLQPDEIAGLERVAAAELRALAEPVEYEADLRYPGAPESRLAPGGKTVRRLLDAYGRDPLFAGAATSPTVRAFMEAYFAERAVLSRVHHNCLMTKHPLYGSQTGWHRDIRYWSFEQPDLVSIWIALGGERVENGGLRFIPGSQRMHFEPEQFDEAGFFRDDLAANTRLIDSSVCPSLEAGDAVFFHCGTLHSAGKNASSQIKQSLVYTYHARTNRPVAGTRSASQPEIPLSSDQE